MDKYKLKSAIHKIFLLGISICFSLVVLEVSAGSILKIYKLEEKVKYLEKKSHDNNRTPIGSFDQCLGWSFKPNVKGRGYSTDYQVDYFVNSKGLRDKEISLDKSPREFRILALGESTVMGQGVNYGQRFTEVIENSLENVEVVNMGVWGFGVDQSLLQLERDGFQFRPDLVILFVFFDFLDRCNYITPHLSKPRFILNQDKSGIELQLRSVESKFKPPQYPTAKPEAKILIGIREFFRRSKFIALLYNIKRIRKLKQVKQKLENDRQRGVQEERVRHYNRADFKQLIYFILQRYRAVCQAQGADFLLVNFESSKKKYLMRICRDLKICFVDLSGVFSYASQIRSLRFNIDPHYNEFAHRVIGEYTGAYLQKKYNLKQNKNYTYEFFGKWKINPE